MSLFSLMSLSGDFFSLAVGLNLKINYKHYYYSINFVIIKLGLIFLLK